MDKFGDLLNEGLAALVNKLSSTQRFTLLWSSDGDVYKSSNGLVQATKDNRLRLFKHLEDVLFKGDAHLRTALLEAAQLEPEAICVFSLRDADAASCDAVARKKIKVSVVGFGPDAGGNLKNLRVLAEKSGGAFAVVTGGKLSEADKIAALLPETTPAYSLKAKDLLAAQKRDPGAVSQKYRGKWIEVEGTVHGFMRRYYATILLEGEFLQGIDCTTDLQEPWQQVSPGQTVRIRGAWGPFGGTLTDCRIVEVKGDPCPTIAAVDLAKECTADRGAAIKRYEDHYLIVPGRLTAKRGERYVEFSLDGDGKAEVVCRFDPEERDWANSIKIGDSIKVMGRFTGNTDPKSIRLHSCRLMR